MSEIQNVNNTYASGGAAQTGDNPPGGIAKTNQATQKDSDGLKIDKNGVATLPGFNYSNNNFSQYSHQRKIDPALMISMLTEVFNQLDEKQGTAFMDQLKNAEPMYAKILQSRLDEMEQKYKKFKESQALEKKNQMASDAQLGIGVALTVIGIIATILTAGALSGFMIGGMVMSASMTTLDVVNRGIKAGKVMYDDPFDPQAKKPLDISIGGLMRMAVEADFASGAHKYPSNIDQNDKKAMAAYRERWVIGATVTVMIIVSALSIGMGAGAFRAAKNMGETAAKAGDIFKNLAPKIADFARENTASIQMVSQSIDMVGDVANLTTSVYQGANTIVRADSTFQLRMAEANLNQLSSYADIMNTYFERIQQGMKESSEGISEIKKNLSDQRSMLAANATQLIAIN